MKKYILLFLFGCSTAKKPVRITRVIFDMPGKTTTVIQKYPVKDSTIVNLDSDGNLKSEP